MIPAWLSLNAAPAERPKTIAIGGVARGGTSFAASLVYHLGVAFAPRRFGRDALTPALELRSLRKAVTAQNAAAMQAAIRGMDDEHDVWAWKFPAIAQTPGLALDHLRNPHFVFIIKDPFAVMMRSHTVKTSQPFLAHDLKRGEGILARYAQMFAFCRTTGRPAFLVSYDGGLRDPAALVTALAAFLGVECRNPEAVVARARDDGRTYLAQSIPTPP